MNACSRSVAADSKFFSSRARAAIEPRPPVPAI